MADKLTLTDAEWRERLTPEQYQVLRRQGTERPSPGAYWDEHGDGTYRCAGAAPRCSPPTPSSTPTAAGRASTRRSPPTSVEEHEDVSLGMRRVEVTCASCGGHLGHVFDDAPDQPTGLRYCINSLSPGPGALKHLQPRGTASPGPTWTPDGSARRAPVVAVGDLHRHLDGDVRVLERVDADVHRTRLHLGWRTRRRTPGR